MKQYGDTTSAIIRLREQLDDLSPHDGCWDPYHTVRSRYPLPEVAFYNGVILCFDIVKPYCPTACYVNLVLLSVSQQIQWFRANVVEFEMLINIKLYLTMDFGIQKISKIIYFL